MRNKDTNTLQSSLLKWYKENRRTFPWRKTNVDAYTVLVSETMLQQTQASRIADLLPVFLSQFPSVVELAKASNAEILRAWKGLGYNSRAIRLRDAAKMVVEKHNGVVPCNEQQLRELPGVGPYTAAAVACFAYRKRTIVVDVNIHRVYSRWLTKRVTTIDVASKNDIHLFAEQIIPAKRADVWHHAVMDFGSTVCTARSPKCSACPLASACPSAGTMKNVTPTKRPEPLIRNEPRRLWRGRVVDALRKEPQGLTLVKLRSVVFGSTNAPEQQAIKAMLQQLCSEEIIERRGQRYQLFDSDSR